MKGVRPTRSLCRLTQRDVQFDLSFRVVCVVLVSENIFKKYFLIGPIASEFHDFVLTQFHRLLVGFNHFRITVHYSVCGIPVLLLILTIYSALWPPGHIVHFN
jgi:hypothetical protein